MAIVGASSLGNGLAVGDAGLLILNLDLVVVLDVPLEGAQVEFALTRYDGLFEFLALLDQQRGILLVHAVEHGAQLLGLALVQGLDGALELGRGIVDEVKDVLAALLVEGVAAANVFQLHGSADVTCVDLVDSGLVLTTNDVDLSQALLAATVHVGQVSTSLEHTAHHLEVGNLTDVALNRGFEEEHAQRTVLVSGNLVAIGVLGSGHIGHVGNDDAHDLQHAVGADVLLGAYENHGEDAAVNHTQADTLDGLLLGQGHLVKELHHEFLVILGSHLKQGHAVLLSLVGQ